MEKMKVIEKEKEKLYFNSYDPDDLDKIITTQNRVTKSMKTQGRKKLFSILVVIDDFADDPSLTRQSKLLHALYTRGRRNSISTIASTQEFAAIHPIIRVNATSLIVYRLRNNRELESFLEEVSGLTGKKELLEIYRLGTKDEYSFLYVNLTARSVSEMFYKNVTARPEVEDTPKLLSLYF